MHIALVHDWLTNMGGAERVVLALSEAYPNAPVYTSVYKEDALPEFKGKDIRPSFLQKVPFAKKYHQLFPSLRPIAFESLDLSAYDVVISSASAEAKGIITKPETLHICYCHTPTRYYWSDYHAYQNRLQFGLLNPLIRMHMPGLTKRMREWDYVAAQRVDAFIANSNTTKARIKKYYGRDAIVIPPPVDTEKFKPTTFSSGDFDLVVSRLVPYKRIDLVVEAYNALKLPLVIIGTGPELNRLRALNQNPHTKFLGLVTEAEKIRYYQTCRAFIFPTEEDAGITPVEAMAAGKPVIAYGKGGALDTVIPGKTGLFFDTQTIEALTATVRSFDPTKYNAHTCIDHAAQYDTKRFQEKIAAFVDAEYSAWRAI